ncbi:bifunctional glycosyltransferase/CDP-glycerol:glycerophosphate glycerophosphotransferase [Glutamicibacter sp. X7]
MLSRTPLISIVVPVYNVQRYIGMTIESVLEQEYENFELILIDDGSTDESGAICDEYAARDERLRVSHVPNAGVSAARNTGIALAKGEYLAFIDGDDLLYPYSLQLMIEQALASGADVVSGNVHRFKGPKSWQSWHHRSSHATDRLDASLDDVPELLYDTVVWNKLYRMDFWKKQGYSFPVGVIFEDIHLAFRAYNEANHVDILSTPIYQWRVREEESSATQQKGNVKNVVDRELALGLLWKDLRAKGNRTLNQTFLTKLIEGDLWFNVSGISEDSQEFNEALCRLVKTYWRKVPTSLRGLISQERRSIYNALARGKALEVLAIREWYKDNKYSLPITKRGSRVLLDRWRGPAFARSMRAADRDLTKETSVVCVISDVAWSDESHFKVFGWAYIPLLDVEPQQIEVVVTDGEREVACQVERTASPMAYSRGKDPFRSYANVGFTASVDVTSLVRQHRRSRRWQFVVRVRSGKIKRETTMNRVWRGGSAAVIGFREVSKDTRVVPVSGPGVPLRLDVRRPKTIMQSIAIDGFAVSGRITVPDSAKISAVELLGPAGTESVPVSFDANGTKAIDFTAQLPQISERLHSTWRFRVTTGTKSSEVAWSENTTVERVQGRGLTVDATPRGWTVLHERYDNAIVEDATVDEDLNLLLRGTWSGPSPVGYVSIALPGNEAKQWVRFEPDAQGAFEVTVPLRQENWYGDLRPYPSAQYELLVCTDPEDPEAVGQLVITDQKSLELPLRYSFEQARVQLDRAKWARVTVRLRPPVPDSESGAYEKAQRELRWAKPAQVEPEDAVFFRTDMGGSAGDSALAIQQELQRRGAKLKYYWAVKDHSIPIPPGGEAVIDGSEKWTEKIARSRFVINNYGAIMGYLDHDHQTYIQTWHGTPLKIIGLSEWKFLNGSPEWLDEKREAAGYWDYLVTASPFTTELFPTEFLYDGPVRELGMPRNDRVALAGPQDRAEILQKLGIDPSQKVALYAPTYRDYLRNNWRAAAYDGLDLDELTEKLGPEWTVITRGHSFNKRAGAVMQGNERVVDATFHPDIAELYIASDVCITDYSSVMFDYAVSRKPLYFFVPDLEDYLSTRPMYMDLEEIAPSPLCRELDELAAELLDVERYPQKYGEAYEAFRQRFAPHDDGYAARRVVDELFLPVLKEHGIEIDR